MSDLSFLDGLNVISDDFLSNGFHQFYTEFQEDLVDFEFVDNFQFDHDYVDIKHDFNMDQILLDIPYNSFELPELTPLCNESCYTVIKESSENLKFDPSAPSSSHTAKTLMCPYEGCQKMYAKPTHLKAHLKRHMNDKPYVCGWPECTWKFSRSDELARHRRSHLGIKPYRCTFCPKAFARSDHLTKHRRVHEKKFKAQNCDYKNIEWPAVPRGRPGRRPKVKIEDDGAMF